MATFSNYVSDTFELILLILLTFIQSRCPHRTFAKVISPSKKLFKIISNKGTA